MSEDVDPDAVVIRFRPTELEKVMNWAEKEHRRTGFYRLSVFASSPLPSESQAATEARLVGVAGLNGIDLKKNKSHWVALRGELAAFDFYKDDDDDLEECPEHYSVDLGSAEGLADACRDFLSRFSRPEKVEQ